MLPKNILLLWPAMLVALLLTAACASTGPQADTTSSASTAGRLSVLTTTGIIADIVHNIGGDAIDLTTLLPPGTDPHAFDPAPRDLALVADADVLFANGLGLEGFLDKMIANAGGQATIIYVTDGLAARAPAAPSEAGPDDPHAWTSPVNALTFVENIRRALSAADPAHADTYRANAQRYTAELQLLDEWVQVQIDTIPPPNRKLVTDHAVFGYYADRYGLEQVGAIVPAFSSAAEPSAADLAQLETEIRRYGVRAVFVAQNLNPALGRQLTDDTGVRMVQLYTGSLGAPGSGADTYLDYIRYNTTAIVAALK